MIQAVLPTLTSADIATPRPKYWSKEHLHAVTELLMPTVIEWIGQDYREAERDKVAEELRDAIDSSVVGLDGYEIAKHLEDDAGWDGVNSDLVEKLDMADVFMHDVITESVKAWVRKFDIKPRLEIGARFRLPATWFGHDAKLRRLGTVMAEIIEVQEDQARYLLNVPALGHVPRGQTGTYGTFLAYEQVEEYLAEEARGEAAKGGEDDGKT